MPEFFIFYFNLDSDLHNKMKLYYLFLREQYAGILKNLAATV